MPHISTNRGHVDEERVRAILLESIGNEKSIWEYYNEMAALDDTSREIEWRGLADTVLVFDGLFAAFLSAFLVFMIPQLQSNSGDVAMDVLIHISQQINNLTTPAFEPPAFQVSSNVATVNVLFFLSLAFVLLDAFLAMLVKGWLQEFDRGWRKSTVAHLRAQGRERRLQELERWNLPGLVALLPILIEGSLLLFCIGLIVLIFPLHKPSAILSTLAFVAGFGFYGITTYVSVVNSYAPFSSPVSRLLVRGLAILQTWRLAITRVARRRAPPPPQEQQESANPSHGGMQSLSLNSEQAELPEPHSADEKSNALPRPRSDIDPQVHIHALERIVTTTAEAVENIPVFLELLDQPVKDPTLRPLNMAKWRKLLHITMGLLRDQSSFPVSAACTLARTMMICYNRETADRQLRVTLQHYLRGRETDNQGPRMPLNHLFSSYIPFWLGDSYGHDMWQAIAFLEPSDAADAELLWMVNTFHRTGSLDYYVEFFIAVLIYISSTEQSRRSQVPLTAAVIYAMHTIASTHQHRGSNPIGDLPGNVSTTESAPMTFCRVDRIDAPDLWSEDCIQIVNGLLQQPLGPDLAWFANLHHDFQHSLIAALYIDSTKQAHARAAFAELLQYTSIKTHLRRWPGAYDQGKLAAYQYMAFSKRTFDQDRYPHAIVHDVIYNVIDEQPLQLSNLRVLEMAVQDIHKTAPHSPDWLKRESFGLTVTVPGDQIGRSLQEVDIWVLLHLDTLLSPQRYILPEDVKELTWHDTPEEVHIAKARLVLYDASEKPDPVLLSMFLWSKDHGVCTHAFKWCLKLVPINQPGTLAGADSTKRFIPEKMGRDWVEHLIHVLCKGKERERLLSWQCLQLYLKPKLTTLPISWCCDFASAFLFPTVHPSDMHEPPAYHSFAALARFMAFDELQAFLPFLATLLELIKSSLDWDRLKSIEDWLARLPVGLENQGAQTQIEHILAIRKQQLVCRAPNGRSMYG